MTLSLRHIVDNQRQRAIAGASQLDIGTLTSEPAGGLCLVNCTGLDEICIVQLGLTVHVGDQVLIARAGGRPVVICELPASGSPTPPPSAPNGKIQEGRVQIPAAAAGTFRGSKWRTDSVAVAQGEWAGQGANHGAWFYGAAPRSRLSSTTITACAVRVQRRSGGAGGPQVAHLYLTTNNTRPAGAVTRTLGPVDVILGIGEAVWVSLPASWGQTIASTGGGIAINGAPYLVLTGLDTDPQTGLLRFDWRR